MRTPSGWMAAAAGAALLGGPAWRATAAADFTLREHLGRGWSNECVSFPLSAAQARAARAGRPLIRHDGQEAVYQVTGTGEAAQIVFQVDLPAYATL